MGDLVLVGGSGDNATDIQAALVYFETARQFSELGNRADAIANYRKAMELNPELYRAQYGLAEILAGQAGGKDEAVRLLKDLLHKLHYKNPTPEVTAARDAAEGLLLGLDELGMACASAANVLVDYAIRAEEARRRESALQLYSEALKLWPACTEAQRRAYRLCKREGWPFPSELIEAVSRDAYLDLTELAPHTAEVRNGELLTNETKWGMPIYNKGEVFRNALWAPAPSRLAYHLEGRYKVFTVKVLVSAFQGETQQIKTLEKELSRPGSGTVRFKIIGDGELLHESEIVSYSTGPVPLRVDVAHVNELVLEADNADGSDLLDFAVWADGRLYMK